MADESEYTESDIWASPSQNVPTRPKTPKTPRTPRTPKTPTGQQDAHAETIDPEAALRKELEGVRNVNESIEGVIAALEKSGGNMNTVLSTVNHASTLLNSWTRILSQTEHNQRLILNPAWKGATEDLAEQEAEALRRQQAAERRAAEEEQRREELRRRREEEESKRRVGTSTSRGTRGLVRTRSTRARAGTVTRGGAASSSVRGSSIASASGRAGSGIGRGLGVARGRPRGTR
ncbi:DASH complex subunit Duo1 [Geosmithia morbida]|uniref:DASH complex subunit DUO1 n=1 Tax=Geosmithia morbida TaxID=1094350 RepID=A0A9P4YWX5_9HYPO|nr:DASH complex subunit Duo1 [Geosmithia morbida]KAF4124365.1 DASH complex subunit Duo1 [Geosmithia morbida]